MGEIAKLLIGVLGVVIGLAIGFGALVLVMQQTGGRLFDTPALGLLVSLGLVGGGAVLTGYFTLWVIGKVTKRKKPTGRDSEKRRTKKK